MRGSVIKRGDSYRAMWRAPDPATGRVKQYTKTYSTKKAAEDAVKEAVRQVDGHSFTPPTKQTIAQFVKDDWLPSLDALVAGGSMKATSASYYRNAAEKHVVPRIGGVPLTLLDAPMLNKLYGQLLTTGRLTGKGKGGPLSPTTVHSVHTTISRMLGDAERWGRVSRNVATKADPPRRTASKGVWWSAEQLRTFAAAVSTDRLTALWVLAMTTGMRRGELLGLRWEDVDLEKGRLTVASTRVVVDYKVIITTPKTKKSARTIALDSDTVKALHAHYLQQRQDAWRWSEAWTDSGLVFVREDGLGIHPDRLLKIFQMAVGNAGLPHIPLHGLRHSYASAGLSAGVAMKTMSERLGHSSLSITADLYSHVAPEVDQEAADRTAAFIFGR